MRPVGSRYLFTACILFVLLLGGNLSIALGCPFCSAVKPTLAQQCDSAAVAFLGECVANSKTKPVGCQFIVRQPLKSATPLAAEQTVFVPQASDLKPGTLALVLGNGETDAAWDRLDWELVPLNEVSFAYVARLPNLRTSAQERLKYFAPFLEHADALVAEDAFLEFGHAPYEQVMQAASFLSASKLREWMNDKKVLPERKGFYGLALGLTARGEDRAFNIAVLEKLINATATAGSDFRAGFDGVLAGYLVANGADAFDALQMRFIADPKAAEGDVRHLLSALRFYHEFGPAENRPAVALMVEQLLVRPGVAAAAVTDLARWQQWSAIQRVVKLYPNADVADAALQRAIVGFLLACPLPNAAEALENLRSRDAAGVAAAERSLALLNGKN